MSYTLQHGANANANYWDNRGFWTPLRWATYHLNADLVQTLLQYKANPNKKSVYYYDNYDYPLHTTLISGTDKPQKQIAIVKALLDAGGNPNLRDKTWESDRYFRRTPLMYAAKNKMTTIVQMLLAAGANPKLRDNFGRTALDYAYEGNPSSNQSVQVIRRLENAMRTLHYPSNSENIRVSNNNNNARA